ncbi:NAD-dependent epimerase/dehydratase family protein [Tenggerimyces flavus]|uniref:NAD-dependent epimerase/dehydratase family protein n=1 Tax=Tenggerimyces flavus TaxID=1708749 RepID=A0ABV7YB25_9ACTN|nr:NAD(P)-dependent oxidoreductase [Tenggerimyces flavus]MBM7783788.1 nucleoside-diphosphate-sugar epimerase [Tenggerimyces flavus]
MHVFLAGATGVVGRRIVPLLVSAGHQVTGTTRRSEKAALLRDLGATPVVVDAYDREQVFAAVAAARPDVVMDQLTDLTAYDVDANARLRREGTTNLVDAALAAGVRRLVVQSLGWIYEPGAEPAGEDEPLDLDSEGARKSSVQDIVDLERTASAAPEAVLLRYGLFYGPGTWYRPDGLKADEARAGKLVADNDVTSWLHVDDAAAAAVLAVEWPSGPVNLCDDEPAPGTAWVPAFCQAVGAPPPSSSEAERNGWARGESNRYARSLGWTPRYPSWREAFRAWESGR